MSKIMTYFKEILHGNYKISMGVLSELNQIAGLAYDILPQDSNDSWFFEKCIKERNNQHIIVAKDKKEIIAFLAYKSNKDGVVELLDIGVKLVKQRQGIGLALINVLMEEKTYKEIFCLVSEYNLAAQKFLKKAGLKYWKTSKEFYGKNCDGYYFRHLKGE